MYTQPVKTTVFIDPDVLYLARVKMLEQKTTLKKLINDGLRIAVQNVPIKAHTSPKIKWGKYNLGIMGKLSRKEIYADL